MVYLSCYLNCQLQCKLDFNRDYGMPKPLLFVKVVTHFHKNTSPQCLCVLDELFNHLYFVAALGWSAALLMWNSCCFFYNNWRFKSEPISRIHVARCVNISLYHVLIRTEINNGTYCESIWRLLDLCFSSLYYAMQCNYVMGQAMFILLRFQRLHNSMDTERFTIFIQIPEVLWWSVFLLFVNAGLGYILKLWFHHISIHACK